MLLTSRNVSAAISFVDIPSSRKAQRRWSFLVSCGHSRSSVRKNEGWTRSKAVRKSSVTARSLNVRSWRRVSSRTGRSLSGRSRRRPPRLSIMRPWNSLTAARSMVNDVSWRLRVSISSMSYSSLRWCSMRSISAMRSDWRRTMRSVRSFDHRASSRPRSSMKATMAIEMIIVRFLTEFCSASFRD